jgi:TRAP-type C4-dicarboxylate transport system substrate-binding protein
VILFASGMVNFKLYEVSKYYTEIGFGSTTWAGLTINSARFARLPKEVQDIIVEVGREYEEQTGIVNRDNYPKQLEAFTKAGGVVRKLPDSVRLEWAQSLAPWPGQKAKELDAAGLPGSQVLELALKAAEDLGYKWPVRYKIK